MALSQGLKQKLQQKLLPQQIQLMKLLQVPTANLEERIKEELEENPALEQGEGEDEIKQEVDEFAENPLDEPAEDFEKEGEQDDPFEFETIEMNDYESDDGIADYRLKDDNYPELEDRQVMPYKIETTFHDMLITQLSLLELDERTEKVAEQIVGSIDDDGYLRREVPSIVDDLAFRQNIVTTDEEVEGLVRKIQLFDPPGVAARNLQECLLIQLKRMAAEGKNVKLAVQVMEKFFDEFTKKHYDKIQKGLNLTDQDFKDVINTILRLNPRPGGNVGERNNNESYVIPDFFVLNNAGKLELTLNSRNAPDLRISGDYRDMLSEYERGSKKDKRQKEAVMFIKQKIDAAKWFIEIIKQRQETLLNTMQAILNHQEAFFLTGDDTTMRPMILKDVAEKTNLDISTVSRVANSKFVQTEFGTYRLKYFFSESISTDSGEEVSTREVKKILSNLIEGESKKKPLSDEILTDMLQEKGYNIARRTVAKYREQLNIPVARLRKGL
jgi:RNA polymerase sigma-54 factor